MKALEILNEQHLVELFGSPVSYDFETLRNGELVVCEFTVGETQYKMAFEKFSPNLYWEVNYGFFAPEEDRIVSKPKGNVSPMDAARVLSTVVKIMSDFIRSKKPNMITFTGRKDVKLASLYKAMIKNLKPKLVALDYSVQVFDGNEIDDFVIMNNRWDRDAGKLKEDQIVNELFGGAGIEVKKVHSGRVNSWEFNVGETRYRLALIESSKYHFELDYGNVDENNSVNFFPTGNQKQAFAVLGTVVKIVLDFIQTHEVASIGFKGNKGERLGDLYIKMAKMLKPKLEQLDFTIQNFDAGMYEDFFIENNKFDFDNNRFYTKKELENAGK